ncbi:MAG: hypothetical protein ONB05_04350 [candidate division KSB1 bacterium]|nr:hypothetical protein [candidate division KSB1 bacterium]
MQGRTLYIPQMSYEGARAMAAAFNSVGIAAEPLPDSDVHSLELSSRYTNGDECLPEKITLGDFLKIVEKDTFDPKKTAFLLPTSNGPCRYGQYQPFLRKVLRELGADDVWVVSPTSSNGYEGFGEQARELIRTAWRAVLASDILRKLLLKTRPYEREKGTTEAVFQESLERLCQVIAENGLGHRQRLKNIQRVLIDIRDRFRRIPADYRKDRPLIGVVGEIFCRLNDFSNDFMIKKIEEHGGEAWLSDVAEWVWYTNEEQRLRLIRNGQRISLAMLGARIKFAFQKYDEHVLYKPFREDFRGYEEPRHIRQILTNSEPYLPSRGALGEMVISVGKAIYLYHKGADGIVDISPFTCMNGIVCEAVFPQVSQDHDHIPIRTFYFDGTQTDLDRDVGIFMELARNYMRKKRVTRRYPAYFH